MKEFIDILRGYTDAQYNEAFLQCFINFLAAKKIIDSNEFQKFVNEHYNEMLKLIIDRDKEKSLEATKKED